MDSTKLLTEKLALSRDLAAIAPEVEHLRSQVASHQTLLAEKLLLQRQLSTAQVELETEKRATIRALAKEGGRKAQDAQLESQIEELQSEVMNERRLRQKAERSVQQTLAESESKQASLKVKAEHELQHAIQEAETTQNSLSSRLEAFRTKLRATKDLLKDAYEELKDARMQTKSDTTASMIRQEKTTGVVPQKHSIAQVDGFSIGTPDGLPHVKRLRRGSTQLGDKSTFSVTPFLNRTGSVASESPPAVYGGRQSTKVTLDTKEKPSNAKLPLEVVPTNSLVKIPLSKKRDGPVHSSQPTKAKKPPSQMTKAKKTGRLRQVQEEAEGELPTRTEAQSSTESVMLSGGNHKQRICESVGDTTFMKKRKKLLGSGGMGRTLFDDVDGGEDALSQGGQPTLGKPISGGPRKTIPNKNGKISVTGFGAISPSKKDKRTGKFRES